MALSWGKERQDLEPCHTLVARGGGAGGGCALLPRLGGTVPHFLASALGGKGKAERKPVSKPETRW